MKEPRRSLYLAAIGIDGYVSRAQLPGAAPTRRLVPVGTGAALDGTGPPAPRQERLPKRTGGARERLSLDVPLQPDPRFGRAVAVDGKPKSPVPVTNCTGDPAQFSLAAIVAGGILWLEELERRLLSREQLLLVAAMARAVALSPRGSNGKPQVTQFNWPMHNNAQLDQSEEAGRAALAGLVARKLEQHRCRAVVLLGESSVRRLPDDTLRDVSGVRTPSTLDMLENPALKKVAWAALQTLVGNS